LKCAGYRRVFNYWNNVYWEEKFIIIKRRVKW
jgi:hypothetical protein